MVERQRAPPLGAMDDLLVLAGLSGCPLPIARGLKDLGWNVQRLGTLGEDDEELIGVILQSLEEKLGVPLDPQPLIGLVEVSRKAAEVSWRVEGRGSDAELLVVHHQKKLQDKMNEWREFSRERLSLEIPSKGKAAVVRWPTRLAKRLEVAGSDQALRENAEKGERARWVKELRKILIEGKCPAVSEGTLGRELTRRFGKGRRASTLRKHVKTWNKMSAWMLSVFKHPWPRAAEQFCFYLESRAEEPCGRTVPGSIFKTLIFVENAGEVLPEDQVNRNPAVRNVLEEVAMQLADVKGGFTKRAWHLPTKVVAAFEDVVMDTRAANYIRVYTWFRLMKVWTGMRYSDTLGLLEKTLEMHEYGVTAVLVKTKTTGPGKKVSHLRIWVSVHGWIKRKHWLEVGYDLWKQMGRAAGLLERDFALPCPSDDLQGFSKRVASYAVASKCSQALFNDLRVKFEGGLVPLVAESCGLLWSEHSERATMRTWSEGTGIPEEIRKQMGRWTPATDQVYERTCRLNTLRSQRKIAEFIKERIGDEDPFDEALIFSALSEKMTLLGYPDGAIELQIEKLKTFGASAESEAKRPRLTIGGGLQDDVDSDGSWEKVGPRKEPPVDDRMPKLDDESGEEDADLAPLADGPEIGRLPTHGTYVLSVVGRSERKTLHRIGECHRVPGLHYSKFEVLGDEPPKAEEFHQACQICFPRGIEAEGRSSDESDAEDLSSSDSSEEGSEEEEEDESQAMRGLGEFRRAR